MRFVGAGALLGVAMMLHGCGDPAVDNGAEARAPSPAASTVGSGEGRGATADEAAFTLSCSGRYAFTHDGRTDEGVQSFKLTIDPRGGRGYMFGWSANGYYSTTMSGMNEEIRPLGAVDATQIQLGSIEINRDTGKYESYPATGSCTRDAEATPIPKGRI